MLSESEIQNFKKNFLDEVIIEVEKIIDKLFEKAINMDSSETPPVLRTYLDDNFVVDPALSREENFKNGVRLLKEFCIEQKAH